MRTFDLPVSGRPVSSPWGSRMKEPKPSLKARLHLLPVNIGAHSDQDFRLYGILRPDTVGGLGVPTDDERLDFERQLDLSLPSPLDGAVTVFLVNPKGLQRHMVAGQIAQGMHQSVLKVNDLKPLWDDYVQTVEGHLDALADIHGAGHQDKNRQRMIVAHGYGTSPAASRSNLGNHSEFLQETLADYLLGRKMALASNPRPLVMPRGHHAVGGAHAARDDIAKIRLAWAIDVPEKLDALVSGFGGRMMIL